MRASFLHISDVHLGYQQYGSKERFNDFGLAFHAAVEFAIERSVDFVLISGDLFHKTAIDPPTLLQAVEGCERLHQAEIPVVAVIGNHDRARYFDRISWLDYLAERGYLYLLSPDFGEDGIRLDPWDGSQGAFVDFDGTRVYGLPYLGASTGLVLSKLPQALATVNRQGIDFVVLMAHFGLEGEVPGLAGGISQALIDPLREHVDYLALGHLHKPFERQGWVYNPGSLEACGIDESSWAGGYYHVTIEAEREPRHKAVHIQGPRRPIHRWIFEVGAYPSPEALLSGLQAFLESKKPEIRRDAAPIVEVRLEGVLAFDRQALDMRQVDEAIREVIAPLICRLRNDTRSMAFEITPEARLPRAELERQVLLDLVRRDSRYRQQADFWVGLIREVKDLTLTDGSPQAIAEALRSRLAEGDGT